VPWRWGPKSNFAPVRFEYVNLHGNESSWNPNSNTLESDGLQRVPGPLPTPSVLSASIILPPASSHCARVLARKDPARVQKVLVFQFLKLLKKSCGFWNCWIRGVSVHTAAEGLRTSRATKQLIHNTRQHVVARYKPITFPLHQPTCKEVRSLLQAGFKTWTKGIPFELEETLW